MNTLGPKAGIMYILGAIGYVRSVETAFWSDVGSWQPRRSKSPNGMV